MAPAWGPGVASVVGPVGLLVVLLVGGCAAEGKSLAVRDVWASESVSGRVSACVPPPPQGPKCGHTAPVCPMKEAERSACWAPVLGGSEANNHDGIKSSNGNDDDGHFPSVSFVPRALPSTDLTSFTSLQPDGSIPSPILQ